MASLSPAAAAVLGKIAKAKTVGSGNNIKDGEYVFAINTIKFEQGYKEFNFIVELRVVTSTAVPDAYYKTYPGKGICPCWATDEGAAIQPPNAVGSEATFLQQPMKQDSASGNIKQFLLAALGVTEEEFDAEEAAAVLRKDEKTPLQITMERICSDAQPLRGLLIAASTARKPIKKGDNAGKPFVNPRFVHIEQSPAGVLRRRQMLEQVEVIPPFTVEMQQVELKEVESSETEAAKASESK
jgi:hypothetical protein